MIWNDPSALFRDTSKVGTVLPSTEAQSSAGERDTNCSLATLRSVKMGSLSALQRVRVALAYAKQQGVQVILLADVFAALSPAAWSLLIEEIAGVVGRHQALVVASQYRLPLADVDTIYVVCDDKIVEHGPRHRVLTQPQHPYTQWLINRASLSPVTMHDWHNLMGSQSNRSLLPSDELP
jgi:ABC-type glutathione transport system ATPase component